MRLELFDRIEETVTLLRQHREEFSQIRKEIKYVLLDVLKDADDSIIDISSRIKTENSLREKIIRNRFYLEYESSEDILYSMHDIIGLKIECRFIDEEELVFQILRKHFNKPHIDDYYTCPAFPHIKLQLGVTQPQKQRNGFSIYRVDGYYEHGKHNVNFELQIKSMVNSFWGDIEHKLVYKNTNYYVYDDFMKRLLNSIKDNLTIVDNQLHTIYDEMENSDRQQMGLVSETNFQKMLAKAINDLFTEKLKDSLGFTINLKNTSDILGHYIYVKNLSYDIENLNATDSLFTIFKRLNSVQIDFKSKISLESEFHSNHPFKERIASFLISKMNEDYEWYVFFQMLFALEIGNNIQDFSLFIDILLNLLIDNYTYASTFIKLSMEEAKKIQLHCLTFLADAMCEVGTIKIIYNKNLNKISKCYMEFIAELESRVISYNDFMHYEKAYRDELVTRVLSLF